MGELMKVRKAARTKLIIVIAQQEVNSVDALEQQNEVFRTAVLREDEVQLDAAVCRTYKTHYQNIKC